MFFFLVNAERISYDTYFDLNKLYSFESKATGPNPKLIDPSIQFSDLDLSNRNLIPKKKKKGSIPRIQKFVTFQKTPIEETVLFSKKKVQFALLEETITEKFEDSFYLDESISSINNEAGFNEAGGDEFNVEEEFKVSPIFDKVTLLERNF